jgi:hypothetical protein
MADKHTQTRFNMKGQQPETKMNQPNRHFRYDGDVYHLLTHSDDAILKQMRQLSDEQIREQQNPIAVKHATDCTCIYNEICLKRRMSGIQPVAKQSSSYVSMSYEIIQFSGSVNDRYIKLQDKLTNWQLKGLITETERAELQKKFFEGGFNPYGNGMISLLVLMMGIALSAPVSYVMLYNGDECYPTYAYINMSIQGSCYQISGPGWTYLAVSWYAYPQTAAARVIFSNAGDCSTADWEDDVPENSCETAPSSSQKRIKVFSRSTLAPTAAYPTPAPTIPSSQFITLYPNNTQQCTENAVVLPWKQCVALPPYFYGPNTSAYFSCMIPTQLTLNIYNDSACTAGPYIGGGISPSLDTCEPFTGYPPGINGYYRAANDLVCLTDAPTRAPTSIAPTAYPPPAPVHSAAPTTSHPTAAPTIITTSPTPAPTTSCPAASSVNIVGWERQIAPLWVTFVDPQSQAIPVASCGPQPIYEQKETTHLHDVFDMFAELLASHIKGDFALSRKARNKLAHALNGNTSRFAKHQVKPIDKEVHLKKIQEAQELLLQQAAALGVVPPTPKLTQARPPVEKEVVKPRLKADWMEVMISGRLNAAKTLWYEAKLVVMIAPLSDVEITDTDFPDEETSKIEDEKTVTAKPQPPRGRETGGRKKEEARARNEDRDNQAVFDQEKWNKGVERVVSTLSKNRTSIYEWWMSHPDSKDFRTMVIEKLWGKDWYRYATMDSNQWLVYCSIFNVSPTTRLFRLLKVFPEWRQALDESDVSATWFDVTSMEWEYAQQLLSAEQVCNTIAVIPVQINGNNGSATNTDDHDPEVRSQINGNNGSATNTDDHAMKTPLCRTQSDVDQQNSTDTVYDMSSFSPGVSYLKGSEMAARLATNPSSTNATHLFVSATALLHADLIDPLNNITLGATLPLPSTTMIPRQVRAGPGAALVDAAFRLPSRILGPVQTLIHPVSDSELMTTIVDAAIKANQNIGRADNTNLNGFLAIDLAWLGRLRAVAGFQMDQCLVKLLLLHKLKSWDYDQSSLPMAQFRAIDQYTATAPVSDVVLDFNDSPIFGEDCGGADAVFPFLGGETGEISFHVTIETVPRNERSNAVWIPATILLQDTSVDVGLALAMFVMMWAPYPFGIFTHTVDSVDTTGGNPAPQKFVHTANLVFVPGQTVLHFILPRVTTSRNPQAQVEANNLVVLRPVTGAVASQLYQPATLLDINFIGGALQSYNLCEYLYTWAAAVNATHIANFLQRLSYTTGIEESVRRCEDLITMTTEIFPSMAANDGVGLPPLYEPNSVQAFTLCSPAVISCEPVLADFPVVVFGRSDFLIFDSDPLAWNKIATGLATSDAPPDLSYVLPDWIANPQAAFWEQLMGMAYAIVWSSHYANVGWSAQTWGTAYGNTTQPEFREQVRNYYQVAWPNMIPMNAVFGPMMANYFTTLTGRRPGIAATRGGTMTIFDMMSPPLGIRATNFTLLNRAPLVWELCDGMIPCNVADIWMQYFSKMLPRWQSSIPLPSGPDSWKGYNANMNNLVVSRALKGGLIDPAYDRQTLNGNETADFSDDMRWNERMMYLVARATTSKRNGGLVANTLSSGAILCQRESATPAWFEEAVIVPPALRGNTICYATGEADGELAFAVALTQLGTQARAAMYHRQQLGWYAWQLAGMISWNDEVTQSTTASKSKWDKRKTETGKVSTSSTESEHGGGQESTM